MSDTNRKIVMKDGRTVEFGEKQRLDKSYGNLPTGEVYCQIDFDNGESVKVVVDPVSATGKTALGHGLSQKLGDAASGADNTNDAFEAILEVASRIAAGEWTETRGTGEGGTAKGASELVEALAMVLGKDKDFVRTVIAELKQADKMALRKTPEVAAAIEKLRAAKAPSKAEQDKVAAGASLLGALKAAGPIAAPAADKPAAPAAPAKTKLADPAAKK